MSHFPLFRSTKEVLLLYGRLILFFHPLLIGQRVIRAVIIWEKLLKVLDVQLWHNLLPSENLQLQFANCYSEVCTIFLAFRH